MQKHRDVKLKGRGIGRFCEVIYVRNLGHYHDRR